MADSSLWRWPLPVVLAVRYLTGRRTRLLHRTAFASLASVTLGVAALVVAMALMSGYRHELEEKLVGGNAAVLVYPIRPGDSGESNRVSERLAELQGVTRVRGVAYGQGTLSTPGGREGEAVTLRGIPRGPDSLAGPSPELRPGSDGVAGVVLGRDLARELEVGAGDRLRLTALGFVEGRPRFRFRTLEVEDTFRSGFAEFDRRWAILAQEIVRDLSGEEGASTLFEVSLDDPGEAPALALRAQEILGSEYLVTDWKSLNSELFSALRLQQRSLFFLLGLIVVVSTFNVASTLMVLVRERLREVGVLTSLGLGRRRLAAAFVLYGGALGSVGTGVGVALGATISWVMTRFEIIRFAPEVAEIYFISAVPFRIELLDLAAIVGFALLVSVLATLPPVWKVLRVEMADALRYE
ncbi:MAG: ABC transporter permease [Thermoanaerobaculia bacterium]|nr:ABC transporter permease [Thermoanaerobaculia bacterium]